ncbi:glycosyltransferase family 4 protein [Marivita sp.]|uniref:glycosyltransferase family 4 protein n=1 Tax=Marivita sp. TaxID=2003365 RepID=UPI0025C6B86F|nr:glycosyltransferase family 4 protein [Marivita sp.]
MASILFVVPRFHTNLFFATKALIEAGHRVAVFAETTSRIEDHSHVAPEVFGTAPDAARLRSALAELQPDLIFARYPSKLSKAIHVAARKARLRILSYDQRPLTQRRGLKKRLSYALEQRAWERITPVRGLDAEAPTDPAAHYLPWPIEELPVPRDTYRDMAGEPVRILCVGKLAQVRKRQDAVIDAMQSLPGGATLTLVGATDRDISGADEAHLARLQKAVADHPWITLQSDVSYGDMPALFAAHHVCVLPSVHETLGWAPIEAMAYGTIPVISEGAGSAGYITSGQNGFRVDLSDEGALRDRLSALVGDPALRLRLSSGARRTAQNDLSPEVFVSRVAALLA